MTHNATSHAIAPLSQFSDAVAANIRTVFTDIDDTMTTDGVLPACAYTAIWNARNAGIDVVLVTGRPAGWCDALARLWPVRGVVGENGALAFWCEDGRMKRIFVDRPEGAAAKLQEIAADVQSQVPGCTLSADQDFRLYDLAIDFCEDVAPLDRAAIDRIIEIFHAHGAVCKESSIHINGWFGDYDKFSMCVRWFQETSGASLNLDRAIYIGDSPNDAPMFGAFKHSVGVANITQFVDQLSHRPTYITPSVGGEGFAEVVDHLLACR